MTRYSGWACGQLCNLSALFLVIFLVVGTQAKVKLSPLITVYLPTGENGDLRFDSGAVSKIAHCPRTNTIYAAGETMLHAINAADPLNQQLKVSRFEPGMDFNEIAVCADRVFVSVNNLRQPDKGQLRVYSTLDQGFRLLALLEVGANPGMIAVREGCKSAVVTLEGEPFVDSNGSVQDPEGEVLIANFQDGIYDNTSIKITRVGFKSFNDKHLSLERYGVRFGSKDKGITLSQDLEPESVVIDEWEDTAHVVLQENNALAKVDLFSGSVLDIEGFNYKSWGSLDTSDMDGGSNVEFWPIRAWFQPDGIQFYEWEGMKLLFTANQGRARDHEATKDITSANLSSSMSEILRNGISDDSDLGRLTFSLKDGVDPATGKYRELYTFGGRSFSIWDVSWGPLGRLFDSASDLEQITDKYCPHLFNRDVTPDDRSDDMGPEPESIAVGKIGGRLYIIVGTKRPGSIFVYSLGKDVLRPRFETIFCGGIPDNGRSFQEMYQQQEIYAAGVKDIKFIPADQSATGKPLLVVVGAKSGTLTFLEVEVTEH